MRIPTGLRRWLVLGLAGGAASAAAFRSWVAPAAIAAAVGREYGGHVGFAGWWVGPSSAGVTGLVLREGPSPSSPAWATAERVTTDLSLGALLRGQTRPGRVALLRPRFVFRVAADGRPRTALPWRGGAGRPLPSVTAEGATLTFRQEGRPAMTVTGIRARLAGEGPGGGRFWARADDPVWGRVDVAGRFAAGFRSAGLRLETLGLVADDARADALPWISPKVWRQFRPRGPVRVALTLGTADGAWQPPGVRAEVSYDGATLALPGLGLVGRDARGVMRVADYVVRLDAVRGRVAGGRVAVDGVMDFSAATSLLDVPVVLDGVRVGDLPPAWGADRLGLAGGLTGTARLRAALGPGGADMDGSCGAGVVTDAGFRGVALGTVRVSARVERASASDPIPDGGAGGRFAPATLSADLEADAVELAPALDRVRALGVARWVPASGRLAVSARAEVPIGSVLDHAAYRIRGVAALSGATIGGLALGVLRARVSVDRGVLEVRPLAGIAAHPRGPGVPAGPEISGGIPGRFPCR